MIPLRRVLCVDDEDDILEVVRLCLELGGLKVFGCHGGREAIERIPSIWPDLILLDVMMPGMDGPATFLEMQKRLPGENIPVVFMTARVRSTETEEYLRLGASAVVAKPFDPATLCSDIERIWLDIQDKRARALRATPAVSPARGALMGNILLVDDDIDFAEALSQQISSAGYAVQSISDSEEAVAACLSDDLVVSPDVIIVDLYMPRRDGIQVIAALRQAGVKTPIIAISGGGSIRFTKMLEVAKVLGANDSLAKPFAASELLGLLAKYAPQERASWAR